MMKTIMERLFDMLTCQFLKVIFYTCPQTEPTIPILIFRVPPLPIFHLTESFQIYLTLRNFCQFSLPDLFFSFPDYRLLNTDYLFHNPQTNLPIMQARLPTTHSRLPTTHSRLPTTHSRLPTFPGRIPRASQPRTLIR